MKINEITEVNPSIISPDVKELGSIFARNNFEIRVVGGAVRDVALGIVVAINDPAAKS